jgi:hypothetical protein
MRDRQAEAEIIAKFNRLTVAWTMLFSDGWYAFYKDEKPLGPFKREIEAASAGLEAWSKESEPDN